MAPVLQLVPAEAHAVQGSRLSIFALLSQYPPRRAMLSPVTEREAGAEGQPLSWGRQGLALGGLSAYPHTALPLAGSLCVRGRVWEAGRV